MKLAWLALLAACSSTSEPELAIVGESTRVRLEDRWPATSAWFDGTHVTLVAARGETLGIQVLHRTAAAISLSLDGARIAGFDVSSYPVTRPSTALYGGSRGRGHYADALTPNATPTTNPAYFEITATAPAGRYGGTLSIGTRHIAVELAITDLALPPLPLSAWAYEDPRELAWASGASTETHARPSAGELQCIAMFRAHGVLLSPDVRLEDWPERRALLAGVRDIPVWIPTDPSRASDAVRGWIAATRGTRQVPFAIPVDEPRTADQRRKVAELSQAVRAAGGGPTTFRYAVTNRFRPDYALVDLFITLDARRTDRLPRWTYNGAPPRAGAMVLDAETPGMRTWGWIAWRWQIATWYIWDALYWHDRHNRRGAPLPGRVLDPTRDPVSFDDGGDHGNFDGVLALPAAEGCRPTLRLAALRRGLQDKLLLELAARCAPEATARLAAKMVPRALGDAGAAPAWSSDDNDWEQARRELLALAACDLAAHVGQ